MAKTNRIDWKDFIKTVTPAGVFQFPKLTEPDCKFSEYGEYSVGVVLTGVEAANLQDIIEVAYADYYKAECLNHGKELKKFETLCYAPTTDRDKKIVSGSTTFKCKRKAGGMYGKGHKKAGQEWEAHFPIFSAAGTEKVTEPIWGGSVGRVSVTLVPWYTPSLGFGVRLQIEAVKILELVSDGDKVPSQYGFDDEDGYQAAPPVATEAASDESVEGSEESGGCDF
jgi:hypothetical protein